MSTWQLWLRLWHFEQLPWLCAGVLLCLYLLSFRAHDWGKLALFVVGIAVFLLATASPIAVLADGTLFTAHVIQHVLLLLVVPPLWILAIPSSARAPSVHAMQPANSFAWPSLNWVAGLGVMWLWHLPTLCVASLRSRPMFVLQVVSLLAAGSAFFWPVLRPSTERRLPPPVAMIYLFTACLACTALGVLLTFSPLSVCSAFSHPNPGGLAAQLRSEWGFTHAIDQQVGGLVMWVPSCLIDGATILVLTKRWFSEGAEDADGPSREPNVAGDAAREPNRESHGIG